MRRKVWDSHKWAGVDQGMKACIHPGELDKDLGW